MHVYIFVYIHMKLYTLYKKVSIHSLAAFSGLYTHTHTHTHTHVYMHTCVNIRVYMYTCVYLRVYTCNDVGYAEGSIHTHTHTHVCVLK